MSGIARTKGGEIIDAFRFGPPEWESIKARYTLGDFLTVCCDSPAILKTSPNGHPFFAHYSDECSTAPETTWHKTAKGLICSYLSRSGLHPVEEHASPDRMWIADVYFETAARKVAIELQHSYQGLPKYLERQRRYQQAGIESYWLLYPERYKTLSLSIAKRRIRDEFGGRFPEGGLFACLPELPYVALEIGAAPEVTGLWPLTPSLEEWVASVVKGTFRFAKGRWSIATA